MRAYVASHLKDMNRKTVYQLISSVGEISKAEISRQTGISSPTVIKIINYFLEAGFVSEAGEGDSALGRKPQILKFNPEAFYSLGIEFEGDYLRLGVVDLLGNIKTLRQTRVRPDFDYILENVLSQEIMELTREAGIHKDKVLGVGLGIPGVVDPENRIVEFAPLVGIFGRKDCGAMLDALSAKVGLPVYIENDVNAAAIGEYVCRKLTPEQDLIYVSLGTGLGAGIILNGRLRRGKRNSAGEIGYMVFDKNYHTFKSKAGWMESLINLNALSQNWKFSAAGHTESASADNSFHQLIDHVASNMALCIANLNALIDVELVVIGGISAEILGKPLLEKTNEYVSGLSLLEVDCQFQKCQDSGVVGVASIVTELKLNELLIE